MIKRISRIVERCYVLFLIISDYYSRVRNAGDMRGVNVLSKKEDMPSNKLA